MTVEELINAAQLEQQYLELADRLKRLESNLNTVPLYQLPPFDYDTRVPLPGNVELLDAQAMSGSTKVAVRWTRPTDPNFSHIEIWVRRTAYNNENPFKVAEATESPAIFTVASDQDTLSVAYLRPVMKDGLGVDLATCPTVAFNIYQFVVDTSLIADGSITSNKIAPNAVHEAHLAAAAVTTSKLADLAVDTNKLANLAVDAAKLADSAVTATKIANAAVGTDKLADLAVDTNKLANLAVDAAKLANAAVTATKIANAAVGSAAIAAAAIGSAHIANGVILTAHIGDAQITSAKIANAAIQSAHIATAAIQSAHIADAQITSAKIATAAIQSAHIADAQITSAKIANAAIQSAHIGVAQIGAAHIANGQITSAHIGLAQVLEAHIANAAITNAKIANLAVTDAKISSLAVDKLLAGTAVFTGDVSFVRSGAGSMTLNASGINITNGSCDLDIGASSVTFNTPGADVSMHTLGFSLFGEFVHTGDYHNLTGHIRMGEFTPGFPNLTIIGSNGSIAARSYQVITGFTGVDYQSRQGVTANISYAKPGGGSGIIEVVQGIVLSVT